LELGQPLASLDKAWELLAASGEFELRRNSWCLTAEHRGRRYTVFANGRLMLNGGAGPQELEQFAATFLGI
jgi:hypothetical protein